VADRIHKVGRVIDGADAANRRSTVKRDLLGPISAYGESGARFMRDGEE
jgi:hypothetical protein